MAEMNLQAVREKFPQYSDMSDEQLTQGIHKKYYSDMPFDEFSKKIGYKPAAQSFTPPATQEEYAQRDTARQRRLAGSRGSDYAAEYRKQVEELPAGGFGEQLKGVVQGAPLAGYAAISSIPGISSVLPSGEKVAEKIYGPATSPSAASGRESGMMLGTGPVGPLALVSPAASAVGRGMKDVSEALGLTGVLKAAPITLFPSKTVERVIAPASTKSEVGEKISDKLMGNLKDLIKGRKEQFDEVAKTYINKGKEFEANILNDYTKLIKDEYASVGSQLSPEEIKLLQQSLSRVSARPAELVSKPGKTKKLVKPEFEALEKERRFLNDVASGMKIEGAEAVPALYARDLANKLEGIIAKYAPNEFGTFKTTYQSLSEPINRFNTLIGKAVSERADKYLPDIAKVDVAQLPGKIFKSRDAMREFKTLSGDPVFVEKLAKEHIVNDLGRVKEAKDITSYIDKNKDWLQEVPEIQKQLEQIARSTVRGDLAKTLAKWASVAGLGYAGANYLGKTIGKIGQILGD